MAEHGVAILGAGIFAKNSHLPALAKTPTLTLKAVYSRSPASSLSLLDATKQFPAFASPVTAYSDDSPGASLADLLARPDIHTVILSLPILVQPSIIEQAWKAGKHVVSEKPVAKDLAESLRLIELWEAEFKPKGINWIIAEQFPYLPSFNKARELIASGKIGELRTFELSLYAFTQPGSKYFETAWRKVPEYQGGFLLDGGVHYFAGLRHALPASDRLSSVVATSRLIQPHLVPFDTLQGLLRTTSGVVGNFTITFGSESRAPLEYVFRGSKGELRVQFGVGSATARTTFVGHDRVSFKGLEEVDVEEWDLVSDGVASEFEAFGKALVGGIGSVEARLVEERTGPRAARRDVGMIEKALESAAKGVWVDIE